MKTAEFDFNLPTELIAQYPLKERDQSRLLHYNPQSKSIKHLNFSDILSILEPGDILVRNTSKVLAARLFASAIGEDNQQSKTEILLIKPYTKDSDGSGSKWQILGKPWKKLKDNHKYKLSNGQEIGIKEVQDNEGKTIKLADFGSYEKFKEAVSEVGMMPIPPYMKREADSSDQDRYQTVYAEECTKGASIAAPTAGLHFTPEIFEKLSEKGIETLDISLHVGTGTFLPIKSEDISEHKMQAEEFSIKKSTWQKILEAKKAGRRVITIGSTSTRCLEALAQMQERNELGSTDSSGSESELIHGSTDIFIYPGYKFKIADAILTNFHLPKSSLILLISAFIGKDELMRTYEEAINERYRFYSYGDCMLIY